jgi:signal transduction histidine kinase
VNFVRASPTLLVFGLVLTDFPSQSSARQKVLKKNREHAVSSDEVIHVMKVLAAGERRFEAEVDAEKAAILAEYRESRQYKKDFLESLRSDLQRSLSVLHDYRQFLALVRQNLNVIFENRHPHRALDEQLALAPQAEKAIYWACRLMAEKIETAFLLLHPERITDDNAFAKFRLHGAVHKYVQIYRPSFTEKGVSLQIVGESIGLVLGNAAAFGVIPHTFIDNALKYAPRGSDVVLEFEESKDAIIMKVTSSGPRIDTDEREHIFDLFSRGRHALRQEENGTGFGLYLAQFVAKAMNTRIAVNQAPSGSAKTGYVTTFSVTFERAG